MTLCWLFTSAMLVSFLPAADRANAIMDQASVQGGLIVHVGCGTGELTAALGGDGKYLVQGLAANPVDLAAARRTVQEVGLYGQVSVRLLEVERLPYADQVVNVIVDECPGTVAESEIMRVLTPGGVYLASDGEGWKKRVKPLSDETDQWTHFLYNASNNAVSHDRVVAPPKSLRWTCGPTYARSHEHLSSVSAMVSGNGRVFYIVDEGPIANVYAAPKWKLVARDAYNGVLLWSRPLGIWESQVRGFRSGPVDIARRMAVHGDRLYVTPCMGDSALVLDAATGETLRTLDGSAGTREILIDDEMVFLVADDLKPEDHAERRKWFADRAQQLTHYEYPRVPILEFGSRRLMAFSESSGDLLWQKADADTAAMLPTVTAVADGAVCLHTSRHLICLDRTTGQERWRTERQLPSSRVTWSTPTLVMVRGVVLVGDRAKRTPVSPEAKEGDWVVENSHKGSAAAAEVIAYDLQDGRRLWQAECFENYDCPFDIFVLGDVVWTGKVLGTRDPGFVAGRDLRTGKVVAEMKSDLDFFIPGMGHHRCYRNKATERYLLTGRSGIEFIEPATGKKIAHHWVRGACQYGVMPANGLTVAPLHSCACHITGKLTGINALSGKSEYPADADADTSRLDKGPAYAGEITVTQDAAAGDWPAYRHDAGRSGVTNVALSAKLKADWNAAVGPTLTPPVVAGGRVFCADKDSHSLIALNQADGGLAWRFTAEGRIDSPPSYADGRLIFGSSSGHVYCLEAATGRLAWRFQAAPTNSQIVSRGQLESSWPVHGSVLVRDHVAYFAAGRSSFLDGGILLYALDMATGKVIATRRFDSLDPDSGEQPKDIVIRFNYDARRVALPDILSADGDDLFMRHLRFDSSFTDLPLDKKHLYSSAGLLDTTWWHRTYWQFGTQMGAGYHGWHLSGNETPAGRILVYDRQHVFGYGRNVYNKSQGGHMSPMGPGYHLFCEPLNPPGSGERGSDKPQKPAPGQPVFTRSFQWSVPADDPVVAMTLTKDVLFIATSSEPWSDERQTGELIAVDPQTGGVLQKMPLTMPSIFDGMAATTDGLFLSLRDGSVSRFVTLQ